MEIASNVTPILSDLAKNMEALEQLVYASKLATEFAKNSRSTNTIKSYASDWRDFDSWCQKSKLLSLPADPRSVACYLTDRASQPFIDPTENFQSPLKTQL